MSTFTVSISFQRTEQLWTVRRAHTILATCATGREALRIGRAMAASLHRRMHCDVRVRVRCNHGLWHTCTYLRTQREEPVATMVLRLLRKARSRQRRDGHDCPHNGTRAQFAGAAAGARRRVYA